MKSILRSGLFRYSVVFLFIAIFTFGFNFLRIFLPDDPASQSISSSESNSSIPACATKSNYKIFPSRNQLVTELRKHNKSSVIYGKGVNPGSNQLLSFQFLNPNALIDLNGYFKRFEAGEVRKDNSSSLLDKYCILLI